MLTFAAIIDLIVLCSCTSYLIRHARLSLSHPATLYLAFHVFVVTYRTAMVLMGSATLYSDWQVKSYSALSAYLPVTQGEIARAVLVLDGILVLMTMAWLTAAVRSKNQSGHGFLKNQELFRSLNLQHLWKMMYWAMPLGVLSLIFLRGLGGRTAEGGELGGWESSSYLSFSKTWPALCIIAFIYWYGFRFILCLPLSFYLLYMSVQGHARFRVILPIILLCMIYVDRHKLRWPPIWMICCLIIVGFLFLPMKIFGRAIREGSDIESVGYAVEQRLADFQSSSNTEASLLDGFAATLTLVDEHPSFFYGQTYLPIVTLPIPRQIWPNKPGLAEWQAEISTSFRPLSVQGMTPTLAGESYANFGYLGVILIPTLFAYLSGWLYYAAYNRPYLSLFRFSYLMFACNFIQVYRDGLVSVFVFTIVQMVPIAFLVVLHLLLPTYSSTRKNALSHSPISSPSLKSGTGDSGSLTSSPIQGSIPMFPPITKAKGSTIIGQ